jgi:sugar/nucleoside kinase (ribokinase family)
MRTTPYPRVVIAGLAVVDVIGRPVAFTRPPRAGSLSYLDSITLTSGGNVSNCGIDLAKLGVRVGIITRVGRDGLGNFLRHEYDRYGLETRGVIVDGASQTSATMVHVDGAGERTFLHTRGCMANFRMKDVESQLPMIARADVFVLGYLGLLPESERGFAGTFALVKRKTKALTLLDTGGTPRRNARLLRGLLPHVDFFLPSFDEARTLTGERDPAAIVGAFRALGATGVVGVKLGADGCYLSTPDRSEHVPAVRVRRVIDATGAGDAFVAGFVAGIVKGLDPFDAARIAAAVAAHCVTEVGASTAIQPLRHYLRRVTTRLSHSPGRRP